MKKFNKEVWKKACTGMVTDECDSLSIPYLCLDDFSSNNSRPIFFGNIKTVQLEEGDFSDENIDEGLGYLDTLKEEDVLFVNGFDSFAYFGELMTRFSISKGIEGVIINGATRDNNYTSGSSLDILYRKKTPVDIKGRGRVSSTGQKIEIQGFDVDTDCFVFADSDGAVIINNVDLDVVETAVKRQIDQENQITKMLDNKVSIFEIIKKFKSF